jgi:hypothetical protein
VLVVWLRRASAMGALLFLASCGRSALYVDFTPDAGAPDRLEPPDAPPDAAPDESAPDAPVPPVAQQVVLFGGFGVDNEALNDTWSFDGSNWSPVAAQAPSPRFLASMSALSVGGRSELVLFGGQAGNGGPIVAETWVFDGATWTHVTPATSPPARDTASMATLSGRVVLFGGTSTGGVPSVMGDTWTFDGTTWSALTGAGPPAREYATMGTLGNEVVLFGGADINGNALGDTWTFDGATWDQVSLTSAPPARYGAQAGTLGAAFYVFGGASGNVGDATGLGDTWSFDGTRWTEVTVTGPLVFPLAGAASLGGSVIGIDARTVGQATFRFDGASWSQIGGVVPFSARTSVAMATLP